MERCHIATCVLFGCRAVFAQGSHDVIAQEWRSYGHDSGGARYSPLEQINRGNVKQLKKAWTYHTGELNPTSKRTPGAFESTPLMVDGTLYFTTAESRAIAIDGETGKQIWAFNPFPDPQTSHRTMVSRGLAYWEGSSPLNCAGQKHKRDKRVFYAASDGRLFALGAETGCLCNGFGSGGAINLREGVADRWSKADYEVTSPPAIYKDLVITGAAVQEYPSKGPSGAVRAFDARTGKLVWRFDPVPQSDQLGHDTWEGDSRKDRSGTNVWSIISVDVARGLIFLPIGSPSYDFYGADRKGQNLFGNSLVALDAATGKLIWYYQMVHHDLWDYDLPAQPNLVTVRRGTRNSRGRASN